MKDVDNFLKRFHSYKNVDDVFTYDCCYWFATILFRRFIRDGATIMYDKLSNHFGTKINGRVYDITGDVTDKFRWTTWESSDIDSSLKKQITNDMIMF